VRLLVRSGLCIFTCVKVAGAPAAVEEMTGCVCIALRKTARAVTQFYDRALKSHRLRVTQLPVLVAASQQGSVPLAKLAPVLGMDRTTLLRNVRPLVRRRLLEVSLAPDSRWTEIRATAAGRALLARVYPDWKRAQARALKSLKGSDWSRSLEALGEAARSAK
jgi:DNA-binding MarR family transcriptional regulator